MKFSSKGIFATLIICVLSIAALKINFPIIKSKLIRRMSEDNYVSIFSQIYANNSWNNGSGDGSDPENAAPYIVLLQKYINDPRFKTIVDLGCGDWQIMRHVHVPADKMYIGYDVVPSLMQVIKAQYTSDNVQFIEIKDLREFKDRGVTGDLLIVKDVAQHWPHREIQYFIDNILPNFKYALITNAYNDGANFVNKDITLGAFRPLDLSAEPFNLTNIETIMQYKGPELKQVLLYTNPAYIS